MKLTFAILFSVYILTSCTSTNRIIEINDSKKEIKGFRLIQEPKLHSAEKDSNVIVNQFFKVKTIFLFEESDTHGPNVTLEFNRTNPILALEPDSVMYLKLDNENIRIVSGIIKQRMAKNASASVHQTGKFEPIAFQFTIPENLWLSIAHSKTIIYKLSSGKKGIEVKPAPAETNQIKEFFRRAMQRRLEIIPLVPPGKAKW